MIQWSKMGWVNRPERLDEDETDGVYGDEEEFLQSMRDGEQQIMYLMRRTEQYEKLSRMGGAVDAAQEPLPLQSIDEEINGHRADDWE